jgi:hypothetical protein
MGADMHDSASTGRATDSHFGDPHSFGDWKEESLAGLTTDKNAIHTCAVQMCQQALERAGTEPALLIKGRYHCRKNAVQVTVRADYHC